MGASHESRTFRLVLLAGAPAVMIAILLLWTGDYSAKLRWTLLALMLGFWLGAALALRERIIRPLQTISNLLAALREGDYSIRARGAAVDDALGLALLEVNTLGETLRRQRLGALEATALMRAVMAEIEVAVFTFDADWRLRLVNRAGERLLAQPAERLLGRDAKGLGLADCLAGEVPRVVERAFPLAAGRWEVRRTTFRQGGTTHQLLVLSDLSHALQAEERLAWRRLVRVLSHEINNSLAPIKSLAATLGGLLQRQPRPSDADQDLRDGLTVISGRAESLGRFMGAYARLARLPRPRPEPLDVTGWVRRVASLDTWHTVEVRPGPEMIIEADGDQLDQLLINLITNAVEATRETGGRVVVTWQNDGGWLVVDVEDDGPGVADMSNLFVPFYTTKPEGSGIGLVLSREIATVHGGTLTLENRRNGGGCRARLRLPRKSPLTSG